MNATSNESRVRDRLQNLLEYLLEYSRLKTPAKLEIADYPWSLSLTSLPIHPCVEVFIQPPEDSEERVLLRVTRPELTPCPEPPELLTPWLRRGWDAYEKKEAFLLHPSEIGPTGEAEESDGAEDTEEAEVFEHPPEVLEAFQQWIQSRQEWRVVETPTRQTNQLFDRFFELKSTLEREGERFAMALGTGVLRWRSDGDKRIEHHLLSQRCSLIFDADVPCFSVCYSDDSLQFPTNLLRDVSDTDLSGLPHLVEKLRHTNFDILSEEADDFLTGLARRLWSQGEYYDSPALEVPQDRPTVQKTPVLLLEPRGRGYVDAAQCLLMNISEFETPAALCDLVGLPVPVPDEQKAQAASMPLLFTKSSNLEQERVARRLASNGSVLVQGPPGTGKTHTIANLIGHLLAQGKSILVTSHTSKALGVVRDKVAPELQGLCVSVLDDGSKGQKQLATAVAAIADKLTETTADELASAAEVLRKQRAQLESDLEGAQKLLLSAHRGEYEALTVADHTIMPSEAARKLREWTGKHDWIPGRVNLTQECPLDESEVAELYRLQEQISADEESLISAGLPPSAELPVPAKFEQICDREGELLELGVEQYRDYWKGDEPDPAHLRELWETAERLVSVIDPTESWHIECLAAGQNEAESKLWQELCDLVDETGQVVAESLSVVLEKGPQVGPLEMPLRRQIEVCDAILNQLRTKGKLGFFSKFKPEWKLFRTACTVGQEAPERAEDYEAIAALLQITAARDKLLARWKRQTEPLGCPQPSPDSPERDTAVVAQKIREALDWHKTAWRDFERALAKIGLDWPRLLRKQPQVNQDRGQLLQLKAAVEGPLAEAVNEKLRALELKRLAQERERSLGVLSHSPSPLTNSLTEALKERDANAYAQSFDRLKALELQTHRAERRTALIQRLAGAAPDWAAQLSERSTGHEGPEAPGPLHEAWLFAQWSQQLKERQSVDLDQLQQRVTDLKEQIRRCTARYVETLTWKHQAQRTGNAQQQALIGWLQLVRKIGKGTGKSAGRLKAKARERLSECRGAVPVWIMPFSRVVESYRPGETMFDVVIVDEASQADVTGLLAMALGREVVVVGDHEQVSPSAIGENSDKVMSLAEEHLRSIPNRELFDGASSVYDMAQRAFGETIRLKEHFRCVPEIIAFSNQLCYDGEIMPLRESDNSLVPAVVSHRVPDGQRQGKAKTNEAEAREIASLIAACTKHPAYDGKTFGVISLVGDDQAYLIEKYLLGKLDVRTIEERRILCGNSAQFQGDERDVMFLSMVDSPTGNGPMRLVGGRKAIVQRYNVAASRAKDQMWIVHSLDPSVDLKPGDIRLQLLQTAEVSVVEEIAKLSAQTESVFEQQVLERLVAAGYRVKPQLPIGSYRVDMVVLGSTCRVAVECDGNAYHPPEQLEADLARQEILERVGNLTFIRIRGSAYFRDPDEAMNRVFERLEELGVDKLGPDQESSPEKASQLREEVSRMAAGIRAQWWPEHQSTEGESDDIWAPLKEAMVDWPSLDILPFASEFNLAALKIVHNNSEIVVVDHSSADLELFLKRASSDFVEVLALNPKAVDEARFRILAALKLDEMVDSREHPAVREKSEASLEITEKVEDSKPQPPRASLTQNQAIVSLLMDVAKADGVLLPEELAEIPNFFRQRFRYDDKSLEEINALVPLYAEKQPPRADVSRVVREMDASVKELVLKAAIELAWSDNEFHEEERRVITSLGMEFDIPPGTVEALLQRPESDSFDPYQALELDSDASPEQIEKAVTSLRIRFAKEKFAQLGPEFQELASTRRDEIERAWQELRPVIISSNVEVLSEPPDPIEPPPEPQTKPTEVQTVQGSDLVVQPYREFEGVAGPSPDTLNMSQIKAGLLKIIECEGPVQVRRAYKKYLDGCGLKNLGSVIKKTLNKALQLAVNSREVSILTEPGKVGFIRNFAYIAGTPKVRLRDLGPRSFDEVSVEEIAEFSKHLESQYGGRTPEHFDALVRFYGIGRVTSKLRERLELCIALQDDPSPPASPSPAVLSAPPASSLPDQTEVAYFPANLEADASKRLSQLEQAILQLFPDKPRYAEILKKRLGLEGAPILTLQELGQQYGLTRERVRQLESKALREVRFFLESGMSGSTRIHPELLKWSQQLESAFRQASSRAATLLETFQRDIKTKLDFEPDPEQGIIALLFEKNGIKIAPGRFNRSYVVRGMDPTKVGDFVFWVGEVESELRSDPRTWSPSEFSDTFQARACKYGLIAEELRDLLPIEFVDEERFRVPLASLRSRANQAYRVLSESNGPLRIEQIAETINSSGAKSIEPANLRNQLITDERFSPVGRNGEWVLTEWGHEADGLDDKVCSNLGYWIEDFFRRSFQTVVPLEKLQEAIEGNAPEIDAERLPDLLANHPAVEPVTNRSGRTLVTLKHGWRQRNQR